MIGKHWPCSSETPLLSRNSITHSPSLINRDLISLRLWMLLPSPSLPHQLQMIKKARLLAEVEMSPWSYWSPQPRTQGQMRVVTEPSSLLSETKESCLSSLLPDSGCRSLLPYLWYYQVYKHSFSLLFIWELN
jgi:hypothetical protein